MVKNRFRHDCRNRFSPVDTRRELANSVGLGERTMGKVMQIDEHAPAAVKEAMDRRELSINQGYNLTRQLQELPEDRREKAAVEAVEREKARKELQKQENEIDRQGQIATLFCKAFEKGCFTDTHRGKTCASGSNAAA